MYSVSSNFLSAVAGNDRTVKLKAAFNSKTELDGEHLFNYTLTEMINSEGITMGAVCSNKIEIKMAMPSTSIALANGWVEPKVGLEINGSVEYVPLGKFYITEIESKDDYKTVTVTGYDAMCKLEEDYETTITTWPASIQNVASDIANQYGFTLASMSWPSININYVEGTCREYLGWIAGLMGKNARFNRDGKLEFKWYKTVSNYSISRALQYQNGLERTKTDSFTVNSVTSGTKDNVLVAGNGVGITFENPFMTQSILNNIKSSIGTVAFKPCELKWHGNPALEVGDIVTVKDKNNSNLTVYVMEQTINIGGGISAEIFCYGDSEANINFSTEGPTGKEIKKLKQDYNALQEAVANATDIINSTKGGIFKLTDSDNDGVNDGFILAEHDGDLTATTKCIVGNYQGIGWSTDGGATYTQAITHQGIVGSSIIAGSISAEQLDLTGLELPYANVTGTPDLSVYIAKDGTIGTEPSSSSTGFKVSTQGLLTASNAVIYGTIYASNGTIAGYNIGTGGYYNNALYRRTSATSSESSPAYEIGLKGDSGSSDLAFYVKKSTDSWSTTSNMFYVNNSGKLYCNNVDIKGDVTASSGSIGGWKVGSLGSYSDCLYSTYCAASSPSSSKPQYAVFLRSTGEADKIAIGVKKRTSSSTNWVDADTPFYVRKDGYVYMNNAYVEGEIKASSGTISGNLEISGALTHTRGDYKVTLRGVQATAGNGIFYVTDTSSGSTKYPVRINGDGSASFTNVNISGSSTIASACIPNLNASKITAGTLEVGRIPNISASKITSGTLDSARIDTSTLTIKSGCTIGSSTYNARIRASSDYYATISADASGNTSYTASVVAIVRAGQAWSSNNSSNINIKSEIHDFDDRYNAFYDNLKPQLFKYNNDLDSGYHMGYIWQETDEAIRKSNLTRNDVGAVYEDNLLYGGLGLRKTDFIALNTWQIQKLKQRVAELEAKLGG